MKRCTKSQAEVKLDKPTRFDHWLRSKLTRKQAEWVWFVLLWLGGFLSVFLLAQLIRKSMGL